MRPLVTITIAAYKSRPEYLSDAIQSALSQSWPEIEVLVSDDSPDQSLRPLVEGFHDVRLKYQHNSPSLGVAQNHWSLFQQARGEFIAVLNHDDLFDSHFLEKLANPLQSDADLALAFCDHWVINEVGERLTEESDRLTTTWGRSDLPEGKIKPFYELFAAQSIPMVMGAVFRRSLLPASLPQQAGPAYDLWLAYLLSREGRGAYFVPERLSSWRAHPENLTSQGSLNWAYGAAECWHTASLDPNLATVRRLTLQKTALSYYSCAVNAWRAGSRQKALQYGVRSLMARPSLKGLVACLLPIIPRRTGT